MKSSAFATSDIVDDQPTRRWPARLAGLLAGLWAGGLLAIAAIGAPAAFALLDRPQAGAVAARMFSQEAHVALALSVAMFLLLRARNRQADSVKGESVLDANLMLVLGALFCTVAGYFALQPMMAPARAGQGPLSFGALHAISVAFYGVKTLFVIALSWRLGGRPL